MLIARLSLLRARPRRGCRRRSGRWRGHREIAGERVRPSRHRIGTPSTERDGDRARWNIVGDGGGQSDPAEVVVHARSQSPSAIARAAASSGCISAVCTRFCVEHHGQVPVGAVDRVMPFEGEEPQRVPAGAVRATGQVGGTRRPGAARPLQVRRWRTRRWHRTRRRCPSVGRRAEPFSSQAPQRQLRRPPQASRPAQVPSAGDHRVGTPRPSKPSRAARSRVTSAFDFDSPTGRWPPHSTRGRRNPTSRRDRDVPASSWREGRCRRIGRCRSRTGRGRP